MWSIFSVDDPLVLPSISPVPNCGDPSRDDLPLISPVPNCDCPSDDDPSAGDKESVSGMHDGGDNDPSGPGADETPSELTSVASFSSPLDKEKPCRSSPFSWLP